MSSHSVGTTSRYVGVICEHLTLSSWILEKCAAANALLQLSETWSFIVESYLRALTLRSKQSDELATICILAVSRVSEIQTFR